MEAAINSGQLPIPIGDKVAIVPFPMLEEDFNLLVETLKLWKKKLVKNQTPQEEMSESELDEIVLKNAPKLH
jgi:hypothetical protein